VGGWLRCNGRDGGGAELTDLATDIVTHYWRVEAKIERKATEEILAIEQKFRPIAKATAGKSAPRRGRVSAQK
jgi:molybdenum-dependent DNA-binding transcriptional regulator ModE